MTSNETELWTFNGINADSGAYLFPTLRTEEIAKIVRGETGDSPYHKQLKRQIKVSKAKLLGPKEGIDPENLAETGWGVIFAHDTDPRIIEALQPLLQRRCEQATAKNKKFYRKFTGSDAYQPGESKMNFLARHGVGPSPADPIKMPYYLLIVASPEQIPFQFQYQLDVQYGVGRIYFDKPEDYKAYAETVVKLEEAAQNMSRKMVWFAPANADDTPTELSEKYLVQALARQIKDYRNDWDFELITKQKATKAELLELMGGNKTPSLLFTATHGLGYPKGHKMQTQNQGALLCQDWPGPAAWVGKAIQRDHYFSADDVADNAQLQGLISFHFACYSAGTPQLDELTYSAKTGAVSIAPSPFIAALPKRLLAHSNGGALAVVGHVERAHSRSFLWNKAGPQLAVFESALKRLLDGHRIGYAMEYFNQRYAEVATMLNDLLIEINQHKTVDDELLAILYLSSHDARNYIIFGDPAVKLQGTNLNPIG